MRIFIGDAGIVLLDRVLIKDIALERFVFCHLPLLDMRLKYETQSSKNIWNENDGKRNTQLGRWQARRSHEGLSETFLFYIGRTDLSNEILVGNQLLVFAHSHKCWSHVPGWFFFFGLFSTCHEFFERRKNKQFTQLTSRNFKNRVRISRIFVA